jgi:tRNA(adenine34) deaminase
MKLAIEQAKLAAIYDEVPVGAVLVSNDGKILAEDHNRTISLSDPSAHAEMLVLRKAASEILNYRLPNTTLYVTVEPCVMCAGAVLHARVGTVVFGAPDPKWGGFGSVYDFSGDRRFNHRLDVVSGILYEESKSLIQGFFRNKRNRSFNQQ